MISGQRIWLGAALLAFWGLGCGISLASVQGSGAAPIPFEDPAALKRLDRTTTRHSVDLSAVTGQGRELSAAEKMQRNANREAMMKNWKIDFGWDPQSYTGKYRHQSGSRAVVMRLVGAGTDFNRDGDSSLAVTKSLIARMKADIQTLKIHSDVLTSFDVTLFPDKEKGPENTMRIYVHKAAKDEHVTLTHVIGGVSHEDLDYILEDFFLRIQDVMSGRVGAKENNPGAGKENASAGGNGGAQQSDQDPAPDQGSSGPGAAPADGTSSGKGNGQ